MTLVVAKLEKGVLTQISDTKESDVNSTLRDSDKIMPGILKTFIIHPYLSISFCTKYVWALEAIKKLKPIVKRRFNIRVVIGILLSIHKKSKGNVDFLVCSIYPKPHLVKISEGQVMKGGKEYWIGDADAASRFKYLCKEKPNNWSGNFDTIINDKDFPNVGGISIGSGTFPKGINYLQKAAVFMPPQEVKSGEAIRFGSAQEGGFAYSLKAPKSSGNSILGVHFYQGNFGYIYNPFNHDYPELINKANQIQFNGKVKESTGIEVDGIKLN